ncbi:MAG: tyrosine-protein phosphatase [Pseudomonadota bacterium]
MHKSALNLDGAVNLRDLGGYRTAEGRRLRSGLLYRSGTLTHLSDSGQEDFHQLGIALICDLRRPDEREAEPTPFPLDKPARLEIPIDPGSAVELRKRLEETGLTLTERIHYMAGLTGELTREHAEDYITMFEGILNTTDGGFLVHCSAGKDRTGVAVALLLHALGVPKSTVIEDYLLTNECIDYEGYIVPKWLARFESQAPQAMPDKESVMALFGVREEYLHAAYAGIEAEFDDAEHYIRERLGLDDQALAELRRRYLD